MFIEFFSKCKTHDGILIVNDNRLSSNDVKDILYLEECINKEKKNNIYYVDVMRGFEMIKSR